MKYSAGLDLIAKTILHNPQFRCVDLQCVGSGSICVNIKGKFDPKDDHCLCQYPMYGEHCEFDETQIYQKSMKLKDSPEFSFRKLILFQNLVCLFWVFVVLVVYFCTCKKFQTSRIRKIPIKKIQKLKKSFSSAVAAPLDDVEEILIEDKNDRFETCDNPTFNQIEYGSFDSDC